MSAEVPRVIIASLFLPYTCAGPNHVNLHQQPPPSTLQPSTALATKYGPKYHCRFDSEGTPISSLASATGGGFIASALRSQSAHPIIPAGRSSKTSGSDGLGSMFEPSSMGNVGLQKAIESVHNNLKDLVWIGQLGIKTDSMTEEEKQKSTAQLRELNCIPVFTSDAETNGHYNRFCKEILWPRMHYILPEYPRESWDEREAWEQYVAVNQLFADAIVNEYKPGNIIWIHDYHLLLVPSMVRKLLPNASIGFFLHIPFPSSEVFRCLHVRKQLLCGLLGADLIGFQTYSFARHFLQTCSRILGYEIDPKGVVLENNCVSIGIFPIGIDTEALHRKRDLPEVAKMVELLGEKYADRKVIVARDKLDPVKGVRQKLLAFELFLSRFPEWLGKVVLVQVASSTTEHADLQMQVSDLVSRINSRFGSIEYTPVVYLHQNISFSHYLALLTMADACLITSLRDGMNLTSHEYIVCQEQKKSPLIISEFAGTYGSFGAAIRINPWDYEEVAAAINEALMMSEEARFQTHRELLRHVTSNTGAYWTMSFISELQKVTEDMARKFSVPIPHLSISSCHSLFASSRKRLLLLTYDGTLTPFEKTPDMQSSNEWLTHVLQGLSSNPQNLIFIVSGRTKASLDHRLGHIPNIGLCAENGCFIKFPGETKWRDLINDSDSCWQSKVLEIFEYYTERTPGSFIEKKEVSVVWHYRLADSQFGDWQARECQNHIADSIENVYPIHCVMGKKFLEVRPRSVSKPSVATLLLDEFKPDFVMYIGNDRSDEDLFVCLNDVQIKSRQLGSQLSGITCLTCTVGSVKLSGAQYFLTGVVEVLSILSSFGNMKHD